MVDRLVADTVSSRILSYQKLDFSRRLQIEIVEELAKKDSPIRSLSALETHRSTESHHGRLEKGHASAPNGTYAKPC